MYTFIYAKEHQLQEISVQLTYVHVDTEDKRYIKKHYSFAELESFVLEVLESYTPYAKLLLCHQNKRNESSKELVFPFESYRTGQLKLAGAVYPTILNEKSLFAKAPTGIGENDLYTLPRSKSNR